MGRAWFSKIYSLFAHGKGLLASLAAAIGFTVSPVLSRRAADVGVPGFQLVLVNELCKFALFVPLAFIFRVPLRGNDWKQTVLMVVNGGMRALGGTLLVLSVILIPPGNALAISQGAAAPIYGMIVAWLIMREAPGWPNIIGIVFQLTGVAMIVFGGTPVLDLSTEHSDSTCANDRNITMEPNVSTLPTGMISCNMTVDNITITTDRGMSGNLIHDPYAAYVVGNLFAVLYPLVLAFVDVLNRKNMRNNAKLTCIVLVEGWGFVIILPIMFLTSTPKWDLELELVFSLIGQGVILTLAVGCLYHGLDSEKAATVYIMLGLSTVLGYVLQYLVIHITPQTLEILGASIIVLAIVLVFLFTWRQRARKGKKEATIEEENEKVQINNELNEIQFHWFESSV
ncbi:solute carrier family 35 member G2-like [Branchiostoma lanceolatum]|uniref:solute carrier family 35 member G2-like n=1 Tax=Branchiostoma lanceolatum TaxID=7740 RepID=UPI00345693E9